ncbi:MAG: peptidoglycan-binding domain-containing protein [Streptosporangiaceae bacterium]
MRTTSIARQDLLDTREYRGDLAFGAEHPVRAARRGTVTWLPGPGARVGRGDPLYRVNGLPSVLFYGSTPLYRRLGTPGQEGRDVQVVHDNLRALGFGATTGSVLTPATASALRCWQHQVGLPETGELGPADVVVRPDAVRVSAVAAVRGDGTAADLMSLTSTDQEVLVRIGAGQVGAIRRGAAVGLTLGDGSEAAARVRGISADLRQVPQVTVAVRPDEPISVPGPVRVRFTVETRPNVLAVSLAALIPLDEGGYAVRTRDGRMLGVRTGLFALGMVEISGAGLREGLHVLTS